MGSLYYGLDANRNVVPINSRDWANGYAKDKRVALTEVGGYHVSTVFLGLDHSFDNGPPLLFETMVFLGGGGSGLACDRYSTWAEAEAGHAAMVQKVMDGTLREEDR